MKTALAENPGRISAGKSGTSSGGKRRLFGLLSAIVAATLLAAGCADIDTTLTLNRDLSGSRIMTAYISDSDMSSNVPATAAELDAVVEGALPSALTYRQFIQSDDGIRAVFTLEFSSIEDYVAKVEELLVAGNVDIDPQVTIEQLDSPFATGAYIDENFSSVDLLAWLEDPLIAAGIAEESERSDILSSGATVVFIDGEEFSTGSQIFVDSAQSQGFSNVSMITKYNDADDTWDRTFIFEMSSYDYPKITEEVDTYFAETVPSGGMLTEHTQDSNSSPNWELEYTGMSAAEVSEITNGVFLSSTAEFGLEQDQGFDSEIAALEGVLVDSASCAQICSYQDETILDEVTLPQGWIQASSAGDPESAGTLTVETTYSPDVPVLKFLEFDAIDVTLRLSSSGGGTLDVSYTLPTSEAEPNADLLASVLVSGVPEGQATVSEGEDQWVYTASLQEPSLLALSQAIEAYLPGSLAEFGEESSFFTQSSWGSLALDLSSRVSAAPVAEGTTYTLATPFMSKFAPGNSYVEPTTVGGSESALVSFAVVMPTLASFIFWGVLALIILVGAALLFVFRDKIAAASAKRKERNLATVAASAGDAPSAAEAEGDFDVPIWTEEDIEVRETVVTPFTEMRQTLPLPAPPTAGSEWSSAPGDFAPPASQGEAETSSVPPTENLTPPSVETQEAAEAAQPEVEIEDDYWEGELS